MKCKYTKPDGTRCKAIALKNNPYCLPHAKQTEKKDISKNNKLIISLPELKIENTKDLPQFLIDTISNVRGGLIEAKIGSVIGYLSSILLRSYEISDFESRLERIEQVISTAFVEIPNQQK